MKFLFLLPIVFLFVQPAVDNALVLPKLDNGLMEKFHIENPNLSAKSIAEYTTKINQALEISSNELNIGFPMTNGKSFLFHNSQKNLIALKDNQGKVIFSSQDEFIHTPVFNQKNISITSTSGLSDLKLKKTYIDFVTEESRILDFGFGTSLPCMENINCYPDDTEQLYKKSVVRIVMTLEEGIGYCTGTLMNNTAENDVPYVLSAFHCDFGYTPLHNFWRFDFNYEADGCLNPAVEPLAQSVTGCALRAQRFETDFQLFELTNEIPYDYDVYFMGWDNRESTVPTSASIIHHPSGDIKKLSREDDPVIVYGLELDWGPDYGVTPASHHFRSYLDLNKFEPGSSGCSLIDENFRVVGQLNGGNNGCVDNAGSYYGRFYYSWFEGGTAATQLSNWLDPLGTNAEFIDGKVMAIPTAKINGTVYDFEGTPVPQTQIVLSGFSEATVFTDATGYFEFEDLQTAQNYSIHISKTTEPNFGINQSDIDALGDHILEHQLITAPLAFMAADVNQSGTITGADVVQIRRVMLEIDSEFAFIDSWLYFDQTQTQLTDITIDDLSTSGHFVELTALKIGDVQ